MKKKQGKSFKQISHKEQKHELNFYTELVTALSRAIASRRLYSRNHPNIYGHIEGIIQLVKSYFAKEEKNIFIGIYEENFILKGKRVFGPSLTGKMLLELAGNLCCGGFIIEKKLQISELNHFFDISVEFSATRSGKITQLEEARELLKDRSIVNIQLVSPYKNNFNSEGENNWTGEDTGESGIPDVFRLKQEMYDAVIGSMAEGNSGRPIDLQRTLSVSEFMLKYMRNSFVDVLQTVVYPKFENYTVNHSIRVSALAVYAASQMGWADKELLAIGSAALLHDVGKCSIPDDILNKKGRLTKAEFGVIQAHPKVGAEILAQQKDVLPHVLAAAWGHHIRYDRRGYPAQSAWAVRYPISSLLQICDVFEALTAVRPYKDPMEPVTAFTIMIKDKGAFHPELLASFIRLMGLYPPGTQVKLDDGRYAIVEKQTASIDRPQVSVFMEKNGEIVDTESRYTLNLEEKEYRLLGIERMILSFEDIVSEITL